MISVVRLLGLIIGSISALLVSNTQIKINNDLAPVLLGNYYYRDGLAELSKLKRHRIFQENSKGVYKVAIVGSSSAESIGCDASWTYKDLSRFPMRNTSYKCSISSHMNSLEYDISKGKVQYFNLAKAGAKFLQVTNISKQLIKSDVKKILYLAQVDYFHKGTYGINNISDDRDRAELIDFLKIKETQGFDNLADALKSSPQKMNWTYDGVYSFMSSKSSTSLVNSTNDEKDDTLVISIKDLTAILLFYLSDKLSLSNDVPGEIVFYPDRFKMESFDGDIKKIIRSLTLFALLSNAIQERQIEFSLVLMPDASLAGSKELLLLRGSPQYQYLVDSGILVADYIDLALQPISENYDGKHLTSLGNKKLASHLHKKLLISARGD